MCCILTVAVLTLVILIASLLFYMTTLLIIILSDSIVYPESFVAFRMWSENALVSPSPSCWMVRIESNE